MPATSLSDTLSSVKLGNLTLIDVLALILTILICLIVIRIILKIVGRLLSNTRLDGRVQKYLLTGLKLLLYLIVIIIVLEKLNVNASSLVALLSVGSLGLTLAAEDILGNMAGGLVILSSHPFSIGDFIEASGTSGTVEEITLNHTKLVTPDGLTVLLPNRSLSSSQMTNYTVLGRRRVTQKVTASYDAPTETVKEACRKAWESIPDLLEDPAPSVYLTQYGESSIEYSIYCWTTPEKYWDVYFALGESLRGAFESAGVEMTYDHLNIHIVENRAK